MRRSGLVLASFALLAAACGGGGDSDAADGDSSSDESTVVDSVPTDTASMIDEEAAIVCSAWGQLIPDARPEVVSELVAVLGNGAPSGVMGALEDLAAADRDPAIVTDRLGTVAGYVDPICGTDTVALLVELAGGTPAGAPACPDLEPVGGQVRATADVDVDLDGVTDVATVSVFDDGRLGVDVAYGAGGRSTLVVVDEMRFGDGNVQIETAADIDGDGDGDLWLIVGSGSSTELFTVVLVDGCSLVRPVAEGTPNLFAVGASVGNLGGIECVDLDGNAVIDGFEQFQGQSTGTAGSYSGTATHWVVDGLALVVLDDRAFTTNGEDPDQFRYAGFACIA